MRCHERDYTPLVGLTTLRTFINLDWLVQSVECPNVLTTNCKLQKDVYHQWEIHYFWSLSYPFKSLVEPNIVWYRTIIVFVINIPISARDVCSNIQILLYKEVRAFCLSLKILLHKLSSSLLGNFYVLGWF